MLRLLLVSAAMSAASLLQAQSLPSAAAPDFSEAGVRPSAADLSARLGGNIFVATLANGGTWRMDYRSSAGYVFFDTGGGARDTGKWRAEDGKVCYEFQRSFPSGCTEFRVVNDALYLKRSSGEVVALQKK